MIETHEIKSREQWLNLRKTDITASVAGAIMGVHEYTTAYSLYALKSGLVTEDIEETPAMIRGLLLEPVALKLIKQQRSDWTISWNGTPGELDGVYYRDAGSRIGATPDCFALNENGEKGVIQVKSVERSIFRKKWFGTGESDDEYEAGEIVPPLWVAIQAMTEAMLVGAEWAAVAPLVIGSGLDQYVIPIPLHEGVMAKLREQVKDFWRRIAENDPPPPDYCRDGRMIGLMYADDNGTEIDLSRDNRAAELCDQRAQRMAERKAASDALEEINAELKHKIGEHSTAFFLGWVASHKIQHRKEHVVPANSFRVLRVKKSP